MPQSSLQGSATSQPQRARLVVSHSSSQRKLTDDERTSLEVDLFSIWEAARSARADMNENLQAWSALYEMEVCEMDWPWVGAANLVLPIVPAELDAMKSYISAKVFVQRLVIVTAGDDDPETARLAPEVEKYYNAELRRIRGDGKTPIDSLKSILHLGLRDGGGPCDVLFTERQEPKIIVTQEPKIDETSGEVSIDDETGAPETERVTSRITETVREVNIVPRLLKEWYLVPDESTSIQTALGVMTIHWMTEKDLKAKVKEAKRNGSGEFYADAVEDVLDLVTSGQTDVSRDRDGSYDKTAGGQINVGQGQGALVSPFFRNRGPAQILRLYSDQFDMDDDGVAEKNIYWFYANSPKLLGWEPYEYVDNNWPTFCFSPFPRVERPYGYSLVERLADITADACAGRNQRRNYIDLALMPLLLQREGDTIRDKDRAFYPGAQWTVENVEQSLKWFVPPPLSPDSFSDEARLDTYVAKLSGQNAPALGSQSSGRRTATENRMQQAAQSVRAEDVAMDYRSFLRGVMQFWHKLNKQYLGAEKQIQTQVSGDLNKAYGDGDKGGVLTLSPDVLSRNFNIDIAGLSDPTDANTRRNEMMAALGVVGKEFPWIKSDPVHDFNLAEWFFDSFTVSGVERFIGTADEAMQRKQAMQAQAQAQAAQQQGQPGQPGQPPQGGPPQPGGPPQGPPQPPGEQ